MWANVGPKLAKFAPINQLIDRGTGSMFGHNRGAQLYTQIYVAQSHTNPFYVAVSKK